MGLGILDVAIGYERYANDNFLNGLGVVEDGDTYLPMHHA